MERSESIMELVAAYVRFVEPSDLRDVATGDGPATSPVCASAAASYLASKTVSVTYQKGC